MVPQDSLFRDDLFKEARENLQDRNEARVIDDIARLIVPSAETLAIYGDFHCKHLIVGMNERWNECIPVTPTLPKPDFLWDSSDLRLLKINSRGWSLILGMFWLRLNFLPSFSLRGGFTSRSLLAKRNVEDLILQTDKMRTV